MQTFVVRVFRSELESPSAGRILCGVVEDIGAGSRTAFSHAGELLRILGHDAQLTPSDPADGVSSEGLRRGSSTSHPFPRRSP